MTVGELKEELDGFGDHLPVHIVMSRTGRDDFYEIGEASLSVTGHPTEDADVVQIEIADTPSAIKR